MDSSKTILVCLMVILPVVAIGSWYFWRWYMLQNTLFMIEQGEMRKHERDVEAALAA